MICRILPFPMTFSDPNPDLKDMSLFDVQCLKLNRDIVTMEY